MLVLALLILPRAAAEDDADSLLRSVDLSALDALAGEEGGFRAGELARKILAGQFDSFTDLAKGIIGELARSLRRELAGFFVRIAVPAAAGAALQMLLGGRTDAARPAGMLCALCCACVLAEYYAGARDIARNLMERLRNASGALAPVMVSAMALTGAADSAALMTPLAAECADIIGNALYTWGTALCSATAAVAVAGSLSERFSLERLYRLGRSLLHWLLGLAMFGFTAFLSVRGAMSAARDSLAMRTARTAIEGMVPIIGGELSDAAGALAASAGMVRSAVGLTGMAAILRLCLQPALRLGVMALSVKIGAAVLEPLADRRLSMMMARFGEVTEMLIALCAACAALVLLLMGGCLFSAHILT